MDGSQHKPQTTLLHRIHHHTNMSKVYANIWIGGLEEAYNVSQTAWIQPTHILNCTDRTRVWYGENEVKTHRIPLKDDETDDTQLLLDGAAKLEEWVQEGGRVFVHCLGGISRSPSVVIAWMILYQGYTFDTAYAHIQKRRDFIRPNEHYVEFLKTLHRAV